MDTTTKSSEKPWIYHCEPYFPANSSVPKWCQVIFRDLFFFILGHYIFWGVPCLILVYYLYTSGNTSYRILAITLVLLYAPSFFDNAHKKAQGRPWQWFRQMKYWKLMHGFLKMKIIREAELNPKKSYMFGYSPHGILILSRIATYGGLWEKTFPGIDARALGATPMFLVPLCREVCLWLGSVDASRSIAEKVAKSGRSIQVYPGGTAEIFLCDPNSTETVIILKKRLGFIKLAIRHGMDIVPSFVFGEKWLFKRWHPPAKVIHFFKDTLKIPFIVFWGRYFLWLVFEPKNGKGFGVVYGKPIQVVKNENPSDEEVAKVHGEYMKEIERLYHTYKESFGYDEIETLMIQ